MGAAMAERINHKLMRCECRSFWQRQLSVASCQVASSRQFATFLLSSLRFGLVCFGSFGLFALLVQTKQISLTLGCLACKCHFSVQITQFITFHLIRRVAVKQSKSPNEKGSLSLSLSPSLSLPLCCFVLTANVFPIRLSGQIGSGSF